MRDPLKFLQANASFRPVERRKTAQQPKISGTKVKKKRGDKKLKLPKVRKAKVFYHGEVTYNWKGTQTVPVPHPCRMILRAEKNEARAADKAAQILNEINLYSI